MKIQSGQAANGWPGAVLNRLEIGSILVSDDTEIYFLASATNWPATYNLGVGILAEMIDTGPDVAANQVTGTVLEGGSFQRAMSLSHPTDPVNVEAMRDHLRIHNIYLEG